MGSGIRPPCVICFDVESDGLYGAPVAVGAVVVDGMGRIADRLLSVRRHVFVSPYAREHVAPALEALEETAKSPADLCDHFWAWLQRVVLAYPDASLFVDCGFPVETSFLELCVDLDPSRERESPYPLHEVATLLHARGVDPDVSREEFVIDLLDGQAIRKHDPLWDAYVSALCVQRALGRVL